MPGRGQVKSTEVYEAEASWINGCLIHPRRRGLARKLWQRRHKKVLPHDLYVCHTCDRPQCILDVHHFIGTAKDNSTDMVAKGRHVGTTGQACHTTPHTHSAKRKMSKSHKKLWLMADYVEKQKVSRNTPEFKVKMAKPRPKQSTAATRLWAMSKFRKKMLEAQKAADHVTPMIEVWERPGYREKMAAIQQSSAHRSLMSKVATEREARKRKERGKA